LGAVFSGIGSGGPAQPILPKYKQNFVPTGCASFQWCWQLAPPTQSKQIFALIGSATFRCICFACLLEDVTHSRKDVFLIKYFQNSTSTGANSNFGNNNSLCRLHTGWEGQQAAKRKEPLLNENCFTQHNNRQHRSNYFKKTEINQTYQSGKWK
jgi:hypothetical protein